MTPKEFRDQHGDNTEWTTTDFESYEVLIETQPAAVACWLCAADNPAGYITCGFCLHRAEDGPDFSFSMRLGTAPDPIPTSPAA